MVVGGDGVSAEPTVWILVHDLGRTGVPIVLARLLRRTASARGCAHVVAIRGGALLDEIEGRVASVTVLEPSGRRSVPDAVSVGLAELGAAGPGAAVRRSAWRRRLRHLPPPDVVLVHGAGAWPVVDVVGAAAPVLLHLHELSAGLARSIPATSLPGVWSRAQRVLAVSRPVADLAVTLGASPRLVDLLPGVVETEVDPVADERVMASVNPGGFPEVMGAGTPGWRKGTDRLAAVAFELDRRDRPERVGWVGGPDPAAPVPPSPARPSPLQEPVRWYDERSDPWSLLGSASVVVVPSREDPLPLVALEAGQHGRAVVAMGTGGLPELLADGRGRAVAGQDVRAFVDAVVGYLADPPAADAAGASLRAHVERHHAAAVVAPQWWSALVDLAGGPTIPPRRRGEGPR